MSTASAGPDGRQPRIVAKTDADTAAVQSALEKLLGSEMQSPSPGRWSLTTSGHGIERSFKFKNFTKTWDFMTAVALQCKLKNHHPEWSNVYTTTFVRWTTHSPVSGLTHKDVELAALCDELARAFGEVAQEKQTAAAEASAGGVSAADAASSTPTAQAGDGAKDSLERLADSAAAVGACDCGPVNLAKG